MNFLLRISLVRVNKSLQVPTGLVTFTEKILNGKFHFLSIDYLSLFAKWDFKIMIHKWMKAVPLNFCDVNTKI